jgi:hypothetical protein
MKEPQDIFKALVISGDEMAETSYNYRLLDDASKSILAQNTLMARQAQNCSMAEAKDIALSSSSYREHLKSCAEASRIAEKAKIRYYATKSYSDHCRTAEATHRASMGRAT